MYGIAPTSSYVSCMTCSALIADTDADRERHDQWHRTSGNNDNDARIHQRINDLLDTYCTVFGTVFGEEKR